MIGQKPRNERLALQRCSGPSVVLAAFLIPIVYYRFLAVPTTSRCPDIPDPHPLPRSNPGPVISAVDAAARERFAAVFAAYLRRHKAAVAQLDAPESWADPKAAAGLRLVVAQVSREVCGWQSQARCRFCAAEELSHHCQHPRTCAAIPVSRGKLSPGRVITVCASDACS